MTTAREARENALKKAAIYQRLFNSYEGVEILEDLKKTFDYPAMVGNEPHKTFVRVGELNVIRYIEEVLRVDTTEVSPNE